MSAFLFRRFARFVLIMVGFSVCTAFLLLVANPGVDKPMAVAGSVIAALLVSMYDFGVFRLESPE